MRRYEIYGLEGLCDDWGYSEPYAAGEAIRSLSRKQELTEEEVERIARNYHCRVVWMEGRNESGI